MCFQFWDLIIFGYFSLYQLASFYQIDSKIKYTGK